VRTHRRDKRYVSIFNTISKCHVKTQNRIPREAAHKIEYKNYFKYDINHP